MDINTLFGDASGGALEAPQAELDLVAYKAKRKQEREQAMLEAAAAKEENDRLAAEDEVNHVIERGQAMREAAANKVENTRFFKDTDGSVKHVGEISGKKVSDFKGTPKDAPTPLVTPGEDINASLHAALASDTSAPNPRPEDLGTVLNRADALQPNSTPAEPAAPTEPDINQALDKNATDLAALEKSSAGMAAEAGKPKPTKRVFSLKDVGSMIETAYAAMPIQIAEWEDAGETTKAAAMTRALKAVRGLSQLDSSKLPAQGRRLESLLRNVDPEILAKFPMPHDDPPAQPAEPGWAARLFGSPDAARMGIRMSQDAAGGVTLRGVPSAGIPGQPGQPGQPGGSGGWVQPDGTVLRVVQAVPPLGRDGKVDKSLKRIAITGPDGTIRDGFVSPTGVVYSPGISAAQGTANAREQAQQRQAGVRAEFGAAKQGVGIQKNGNIATPDEIAKANRDATSDLPAPQQKVLLGIQAGLDKDRKGQMKELGIIRTAYAEYGKNYDAAGNFTGKATDDLNEGIADNALITTVERAVRNSKPTNRDIQSIEESISLVASLKNRLAGLTGAKAKLDPSARKSLLAALDATSESAEATNRDRVKTAVGRLADANIPDRVSSNFGRPMFPEHVLPSVDRFKVIRALADRSTRAKAIQDANAIASAHPEYKAAMDSLVENY